MIPPSNYRQYIVTTIKTIYLNVFRGFVSNNYLPQDGSSARRETADKHLRAKVEIIATRQSEKQKKEYHLVENS